MGKDINKHRNKFEEVQMRELDKRNMIMSLKDEADTMVKSREKKKTEREP